MKTEEAKARAQNAIESLRELSECYSDFTVNMRGFSEELKDVGKLWRAGNKSRLIKLGLALIVFPEPTPISETIGACLVAAGAVQQAIRKRALFVEDVPKVYARAFRDVITISQERARASEVT
ncbi:MAG: hypothetical protein WCC63_05945 [Candidatus Bathyarchaeia archaeon]